MTKVVKRYLLRSEILFLNKSAAGFCQRFFIVFFSEIHINFDRKNIDERRFTMETILSIWNYLTIHLYQPVWNGLVALWEKVLVPFGSSFISWIQGYIPWCKSFADFCADFFKLRYQGRIYSFMIMLPLAVIVVIITKLTRRRLRRVRRSRK